MMANFSVTLSSVDCSQGNGQCFLINVEPAGFHGTGFPRSFDGPSKFREAMSKLGIIEPTHDQILVPVSRGESFFLHMEMNDEMAAEFGWLKTEVSASK